MVCGRDVCRRDVVMVGGRDVIMVGVVSGVDVCERDWHGVWS